MNKYNFLEGIYIKVNFNNSKVRNMTIVKTMPILDLLPFLVFLFFILVLFLFLPQFIVCILLLFPILWLLFNKIIYFDFENKVVTKYWRIGVFRFNKEFELDLKTSISIEIIEDKLVLDGISNSNLVYFILNNRKYHLLYISSDSTINFIKKNISLSTP